MSKQSQATIADLKARRAEIAAELDVARRRALVLPIPRFVDAARRLAAELKAIEGGMLAVLGAAFGL